MDLKKIRALLEKYYNGESNIEEEKILRDYFNQDNITDEFIADKDIFIFNSSEQESLEQLPDLSEQIWTTLNEQPVEYSINKKFLYWTLRIAAGILVLLASYFLLNDQFILDDSKYQAVDTFENPEEAYKQAKQTLLYVSAMLNNGAEHLEPIQKINEGTQKLSPLSSFNDGIKELKQIKKYQIGNKYIKQ